MVMQSINARNDRINDLDTRSLQPQPVYHSLTISVQVRDAKMSYAEITSRGPKQTPEEAAAPQLPQIIPNEPVETLSLVDVDSGSVRTVPSDYFDQDIQTTTQLDRVEREQDQVAAVEAAEAAAVEKARKAERATAAASRNVDSWLAARFAALGDGPAGALVVLNLVGVVAASSWLSYRAWGLYEAGRLSWRTVGLGVGLVGLVGAVEVALGRYLYKTKSTKS